MLFEKPYEKSNLLENYIQIIKFSPVRFNIFYRFVIQFVIEKIRRDKW